MTGLGPMACLMNCPAFKGRSYEIDVMLAEEVHTVPKDSYNEVRDFTDRLRRLWVGVPRA